MRIATWNLQSDKKLTEEREALFQKAMQEIDADVWVITESWTNRCLISGYSLVSQSCEASDIERHRRWVAIWSRLDSEPLEVKHQPDRMACGRITNSGQQDVVVIGTVLPWQFDRLWPYSDGFSRALNIQTAEWRRLSDESEGCDFVVAGDFNQALPHQRYYGSRQNETALNNVMETLDLPCPTVGNDLLTGKPRIDHIVVRRDGLESPVVLKAGGWQVPNIDGKQITDHSGVYIDLASSSSP